MTLPQINVAMQRAWFTQTVTNLQTQLAQAQANSQPALVAQITQQLMNAQTELAALPQ